MDILRVTRWVDESGTADTVGAEPLYVLGSEGSESVGDEDAWAVEAIVHGRPKYGPYMYLTPNDGDRFEVLTPEEWPDEVCRTMALRAFDIEGDEQ